MSETMAERWLYVQENIVLNVDFHSIFKNHRNRRSELLRKYYSFFYTCNCYSILVLEIFAKIRRYHYSEFYLYLIVHLQQRVRQNWLTIASRPNLAFTHYIFTDFLYNFDKDTVMNSINNYTRFYITTQVHTFALLSKVKKRALSFQYSRSLPKLLSVRTNDISRFREHLQCDK